MASASLRFGRAASWVVALATSFAVVCCGSRAGAAISATILTNIFAPDGNGAFVGAGPPTLNDSSRMAFAATLTGTNGGPLSPDQFGVFYNDFSTITQVARGLGMAPGGNEVFGQSFTSPPMLNNSLSNGDLAFTASRNGVAGTAGVYRGLPLTVIKERQSQTPNGNGTFSSVGIAGFNDAGQVAFSGSLTGTNPSGANSGIYRGDGTTTTEIVRRTNTAPDNNGTFTGFNTPAMNESGQVAFSATLSVGATATGVFRGTGGTLTQIARQGAAAPAFGVGTNGNYGTIGNDVAINDAGQVAFVSTLTGTVGGTTDDLGLFRANGTTAAIVAGKGRPAPDRFGNLSGTFLSFDPPTMNSSGQVAFAAGLANTPGGFADNRGIYLANAAAVTQVVRQGDPAPDGNGAFQLTNVTTRTAINDGGQAAFYCTFTGATVGTEFGIFQYTPGQALQKVVRTGDLIGGSAITAIELAARGAGTTSNDLESSGLNGKGQVAFNFTLANGNSGVALWTGLIAGDFNENGIVNNQDLTRWKQNFGKLTGATHMQGDANGDGRVDGADLLVWQRQLGVGATASPAAGAVPEPTALVGAMIVAGFVAASRRRRVA